jgi:hypothetical protein
MFIKLKQVSKKLFTSNLESSIQSIPIILLENIIRNLKETNRESITVVELETMLENLRRTFSQ